jgi:ribonucrease Y
MDIIAAAALIAVGIVAAAVAYAKVGGRAQAASLAGPVPTSGPSASAMTAAAPAMPVSPPVAGPLTVAIPVDVDAADSQRAADLARREASIARRESELRDERDAIGAEHQELTRELERVSGLSAARAKQMLLKELEDQTRHDAARRIRQIEEETKREADRRVRNILSVCMQRLAAGHAAETTVSVVQLSADEMKGRIIGREGRNIRALENLTGVDFIIDDTPGAVVLSGFDGVRREIARITLEKLLQDGRIHPARIEET